MYVYNEYRWEKCMKCIWLKLSHDALVLVFIDNIIVIVNNKRSDNELLSNKFEKVDKLINSIKSVAIHMCNGRKIGNIG